MSLPKTPIKGDAETRRFLEAIRQELVRTAGQMVTIADMRQNGFFERNGIPLDFEDPNVAAPTVPTNLQADGAFENIVVTWDFSDYTGHSHSRIYRSNSPVFASAEVLANIDGRVYTDLVGSGATYYYWVSNVNVNGIESATSQADGVMGQTQVNTQYLLSNLTNSITSSQLAASLGSRIDLIDAPSTIANSVNARLLDEATQRANAILSEASARSSGDAALQTQINTIVASTSGDLSDVIAAVQAEQTARTNADAAEAAARETLATQIRGSYTGTDISFLTAGLLYNERVARTTADSAEASARSALAATVTSNFNTLSASITAEQTARANGDAAEASARDVLATQIRGSYTGTDINAVSAGLIYNERVARVNADSAEASARSALAVTVTNNYNTLNAAISSEATTRANADSAISSSVTTLQAQVNSNTAAISTEQTARVNADNSLFAQYTVKIDTNGYVSGFGLASTVNNASPFSSFIIRADSFAISNPSGPSVAPATPFIVRTTPTTINGVSVPVGVYMSDALIQNGSISNAKIGNAAIDDAKIANLSASKITTGQLDAARIRVDDVTLDTYFDSGIGANRLQIKNLSVDNAKIKDAAVDTLKIAGNAVTLPLTFTASDVYVNTSITVTPPGTTCNFTYVGPGNGDLNSSFVYVGPGNGDWAYLCTTSSGSYTGGHTVLETSNITVGDSTSGGLILVFYATMDATALKDAGQYLLILIDKNDGAGYQIARQTKAGVTTNNGSTFSALPIALATTVGNVQQVKIKVVTGKYKISSAALDNASYLRDVTLSVLGAKR